MHCPTRVVAAFNAGVTTERLKPRLVRTDRVTPGAEPAPRWKPHPGARWMSPVLLACFAASGFAALVYEIVWFQLLQYVLGVTAISVGILLAAYMGGLGLGSAWAPRLGRLTSANPMRVYGLLELGIGVFGIAIVYTMPLVSRLYGTLGVPAPWDLVLRAFIAGAALLPPTMLMGATLPTVAAWVESAPREVARLGGLYAANTAGAIAGFYLLRVHDITTATFTAVATNLAIGVVALAMSSRLGNAPRLALREPAARPASRQRTVLVTIALSGLSALGAEVVWTRLMALLLGQTVYTFSIILAVLLAGLALGSWLGTIRARGSSDPARDLGFCQALLTAAIAWASFTLARSLPFWPVVPAIAVSPWIDFQLDLVRCAWVVTPAALLWGASMPLALAAASEPGADPRPVVASVYAANTRGASAGALLFTFWLVPVFGTGGAQSALIVVAGASAVTAFANGVFAPAARRLAGRRGALALATLVAMVLLARSVTPIPGLLVAYGRSLANRLGTKDVATNAPVPVPDLLYVGEGMNESVAVSGTPQVRMFHVSGKTEASTSLRDMRLQRMLADLPALIHPEPRSVLIVGFGAGVTAGSFVPFPSVQRIVICEIEPLIPERVAPFFVNENYDVAHDPRVSIVYDDARHFLLTTKEKFDIITSDPIHPWVKGSAALYSQEYFALVRAHLNPGGVVSQWLPLYQSSEATIRGEVATFFSAFPGGSLWANNVRGQGYDMVMLGSERGQSIDLNGLNARLQRPDHARVVQSLASVGFGSAAELLACYAGRQSDLGSWLAGAAINSDRKLWLQYQAGLETYVEDEAKISDHLARYRVFPDDLFVGSDEFKDAIRESGSEEPGGE